MKVLFVFPSKNGFSGAALSPLHLILGLLKLGIQVYVVVTEPPLNHRIFVDRLIENKAKLFIIPSNESGLKYWKVLTKKALEVLDENEIDIVHLHLPKLVYFLGKEVKKRKKKLVMTLSGDPIFEVANLGFFIKIKTKQFWNNSIKYSDIICPVSYWLSNQIQKNNDIKKLQVVHNAIDVEKFIDLHAGIRKKHNIDPNEFVILTIARLTEVKGLDILINAYSIFVKNQKNPSKLIIIGKGELKNNLIELAKKLEILHNIIFIEFVSNLADYISDSDIFVMTSNYEPFGMTAAEAGVVGKPIIVSKTGGLMEIIENGRSGFSFEPGNFVELSNLFEKLSNNNELRERIGDNAKKRILEKFSPKVIAEKFIKIYSDLTLD